MEGRSYCSFLLLSLRWWGECLHSLYAGTHKPEGAYLLEVMGTLCSSAPCCPQRSLADPWPKEQDRWCQMRLSPACPVSKLFPSCFLSLDDCTGFEPGLASEGWASLDTCCQGKLLARTSDCVTDSLHHLPTVLYAWARLQGMIISQAWLPMDQREG